MSDYIKITALDGPVAETTDEASELQNKYKGVAHGWVQWKGTDVCMDIHCKCGALTHVDGDFCYHVQCFECGRIYFCNGHIELIELVQAPDSCMICLSE